MAISRKPAVKLEAVDALIEKGGSVPSCQPSGRERASLVQLRLAPSVLAQIDAALDARVVRIPRHTWLLEAIHEKLALAKGQK